MAGDANALGVVAAESGIDAVYLFEAIDHSRLRQAMRGEPSADKGKASTTAKITTPIIASLIRRLFRSAPKADMVSPSLDLASCPPCFIDRNHAAVSQRRGPLFRSNELAVASSLPRETGVQGSVPSIGPRMRAFAG
jgi:hypothetical protein